MAIEFEWHFNAPYRCFELDYSMFLCAVLVWNLLHAKIKPKQVTRHKKKTRALARSFQFTRDVIRYRKETKNITKQRQQPQRWVKERDDDYWGWSFGWNMHFVKRHNFRKWFIRMQQQQHQQRQNQTASTLKQQFENDFCF